MHSHTLTVIMPAVALAVTVWAVRPGISCWSAYEIVDVCVPELVEVVVNFCVAVNSTFMPLLR